MEFLNLMKTASANSQSQNRSSNMTNNSTESCFARKHEFEDIGIDQVFLLIGYGLSGLAVVSINFVLIRALLKQPRTRATVLLLILSISDVGVGFISIPFVMLRFAYLSKNMYCALLPFTSFFLYFPAAFSMGVTTIISIDRCLMVTKSIFHTKYVTTGVTIFKLIVVFVISFGWSFVNTVTFSLDKNSKVVWILIYYQAVVQVVIVIFTCGLNLHLYCFVKRTSRKMATSRHEGATESYSSRLTKTIAYIFFCMLLFTGTQVLMSAIRRMLNLNAIFRRNLSWWGVLLIYSNSYVNAIIVLTRSSNLRTTAQKNKANIKMSPRLSIDTRIQTKK